MDAPSDQRRESSKAMSILEAARACVAEHGVGEATFERIADRAGVSRGLLRYHFGSKDGLLLEVCRDMCRFQVRRVTEALDRATSPDEIVAVLGAELQEFLGGSSNFALVLELWALAERDEEIRRELRQLYTEQREAFAAALRRADEQGRASLKADADAIADVLLAFSDGLGVQTRVEPDRSLDARLEAALLAARYLIEDK